MARNEQVQMLYIFIPFFHSANHYSVLPCNRRHNSLKRERLQKRIGSEEIILLEGQNQGNCDLASVSSSSLFLDNSGLYMWLRRRQAT